STARSEDRDERSDPGKKVETFRHRRRENLLAVFLLVGIEDLLGGLTCGERFCDVLADRDCKAALEMVARRDRQAAAALAGQRLFDLALAGGRDGEGRCPQGQSGYRYDDGESKPPTGPQHQWTGPVTAAVSLARSRSTTRLAGN